MRERVSIIIVKDNQLLLMARWRHGRHYHVLIGGGIDPGETPRIAANREVIEETSLQITPGPELWQRAIPEKELYEHAFLVTKFSGEPQLGNGPEASEQSEHNVYKLIWVPFGELAMLDLYPGPVDFEQIQKFIKAL